MIGEIDTEKVIYTIKSNKTKFIKIFNKIKFNKILSKRILALYCVGWGKDVFLTVRMSYSSHSNHFCEIVFSSFSKPFLNHDLPLYFASNRVSKIAFVRYVYVIS
jgi:hypothetical protein